MFDLMIRKNIIPWGKSADWEQMDEINKMEDLLEKIRVGNIFNFDYGVFDHIDEQHVEIQVPGLTRNDLTVSLKHRTLTVSYQENEKNAKTKNRFIKPFQKSYHLNDDIDIDKISIECRDGILYIHLPKYEHSKERFLEVK